MRTTPDNAIDFESDTRIAKDRFVVTYGIKANTYEEANEMIWGVQLEQTVEFPYEFIEKDWIKNEVVGRLERLEEVNGLFEADISYLSELASMEITQFLNVVFGNSSLHPGFWVKKIKLSESLKKMAKGPRFGLTGMRELLGVPKRAMLQAVIKPMGLTTQELASMCSAYAMGGADVIKDDHGLVNQCFSPFEERVARCAAAVRDANAKTGKNVIYAANITGDNAFVTERAYRAKELGATAIMVAPGLIGFDRLAALAKDDNLGLPIISHPSFSGGFLMPGISGIEAPVWFGFLNRFCGADMSIFVSYGGRFTFSAELCRKVIDEMISPSYEWKKTCPSPGGGITETRIPELIKIYGRDVMFLVGGDMFRRSGDLKSNAGFFQMLLEQEAEKS